ncbi:L,D-transpeptidase [Hyphomicrobium sp.]|uniref:L,D-transpeptidase n=1 Tax=Hyphomicrobium sp. TaxID=82 RepID=UPI000FAABAF6|nr:L,D-transpeptidase [Hyphomicrobium sp.]RUO98111.1 MAG: L,D-transpeptidase [Hyphomicrobium sp.]
MLARNSKKTFLLAIASISLLAGSASIAAAQQWSPWDGPRYSAPYGDDRYDDEGSRADNRYDPYNDPRRYDPRYNGDDDGSFDQRDSGPRVDRRDNYRDNYRDTYRDPGSRGRYEDRDDYGAWDAAPSQEEEDRLSKSQGANGGPRPPIRAVAPPTVAFSGPYAPGSIVIDTSARKLYYVLTSNTAYAYPIGVGRQGFAWTGKEKVSRIADWPDWYPPAEMRQRQPGLPVRMLGGIRNPLGAKAIYLGNTLYRIHGTNEPKSIGTAASSGCFRMMNENVLHLASLVHVGTEVTIVRSLGGRIASSAKAAPSRPKSAYVPYAPRQIDRRPFDDADDYYNPYYGWR